MDFIGHAGELLGFATQNIVQALHLLGHDREITLIILHLRLNGLVLDDSRFQFGVPRAEIIDLLRFVLQQSIQPIHFRSHSGTPPFGLLILLLEHPQVIDVRLISGDLMSEILDSPSIALHLILEILIIPLHHRIILNGDFQFGHPSLPLINLPQSLLQQPIQPLNLRTQRRHLILVIPQLPLQIPIPIGLGLLPRQPLLPLIHLL